MPREVSGMSESLLTNVALVALLAEVDPIGVTVEVRLEAEDVAADAALQVRPFPQMDLAQVFL